MCTDLNGHAWKSLTKETDKHAIVQLADHQKHKSSHEQNKFVLHKKASGKKQESEHFSRRHASYLQDLTEMKAKREAELAALREAEDMKR